MKVFVSLISIIAVIFIITFPLWTAIHAWRKNMKVLTVLIGLGYFFPPIAAGIAAIAIFFVKPWHPNMDYLPSPQLYIGWGTKFYCASKQENDGTVVTTQWFTMFYIPIIPIQSYRIALGVESTNFQGAVITSSRSFQIYDVLKLKKEHIFKVYGLLLGYVLCLTGMFSLASRFPGGTDLMTSATIGFTVIFLIIGYFLLRVR